MLAPRYNPKLGEESEVRYGRDGNNETLKHEIISKPGSFEFTMPGTRIDLVNP
jgi:hypothetical protein